MHLSEWQMKSVINIADGSKLGVICDMDVDARTGRITAMMVCAQGKWWSRIWDMNNAVWIAWTHVVKIGADVILVRMDASSQAKQDTDVVE